MHILTSELYRSANYVFEAKLASVRMRIGPLLIAAEHLGIPVTLGEIAPTNADIIFVGKMRASNFESQEHSWLTQIDQAISLGKRVILDYTDHHLETNSAVSPLYEKALSKVEEVITTNNYLKERLVQTYRKSKTFYVVEDFVEFTARKPKEKNVSKTTVLWFGHPSNIASLVPVICSWPRVSRPVEMIIVSTSASAEFLQRYPFTSTPPIDFKFADWSVLALESMAEISDCAIITADTSGPKKFASNNRLTTALNLGLPTVAAPVLSYLEFSDYFLPLNGSSLRRVLSTPNNFFHLVSVFQEKTFGRFSQIKIVSDWIEILKKSEI